MFDGLSTNRLYIGAVGLGDKRFRLRFRLELPHKSVVKIQNGMHVEDNRAGTDVKGKSVLRFAHSKAPLSVASGMLKNCWHELQNQLPGFGPLPISLNLRHVAASRIVSPITPTCTDAVLCEPHCVHGGTAIRMNLS
jgi:hypothetical protein